MKYQMANKLSYSYVYLIWPKKKPLDNMLNAVKRQRNLGLSFSLSLFNNIFESIFLSPFPETICLEKIIN
jgi:hypothetical protein